VVQGCDRVSRIVNLLGPCDFGSGKGRGQFLSLLFSDLRLKFVLAKVKKKLK
jgi:hypothetical protein